MSTHPYVSEWRESRLTELSARYLRAQNLPGALV